jgi:hypothetical protein
MDATGLYLHSKQKNEDSSLHIFNEHKPDSQQFIKT